MQMLNTNSHNATYESYIVQMNGLDQLGGYI